MRIDILRIRWLVCWIFSDIANRFLSHEARLAQDVAKSICLINSSIFPFLQYYQKDDISL